MEQPILTDAEMNRLSEIRNTHECPVRCSKEDSPAVLADMAGIRHKQRGELLGMVDKLLAGVDKLKRGVTNSDVEWQHAHNLAAQCDRLNAENAKLKNDNGELRCINQALRADIGGTVVATVNQSLRGELHAVRADLRDTRAKLDHALKGLAQANGRELRVIKSSDHARYKVEITPEYLHADFRAPAMRAVSTVPAKIMNLADLVERYNEVVAAVADDSEGWLDSGDAP